MHDDRITEAATRHQALLELFLSGNRELLADFAVQLTGAFQQGGRLFLAGSGPFAAIAGILGQQFLYRQTLERPPLPAMALVHDAGLATFLATEEQGSQLFSRQLRALAGEQDILLLLAGTSLGAAEREALAAARQIGCRVALICSAQAEAPEPGPDLTLCLPTDNLPGLLAATLFAGQILCALVEAELFNI